MKKLMIILGVVCMMHANAQSTFIQGTITDSLSHTPLENAAVRIYNGSETVTDRDGKFKINCSGDSVRLTVSFVGFETYHKKVACPCTLDIGLKNLAGDLNTVEITATSNPGKALLYQPVSIARIGEKEINRGTGLLLDDAINTNIAGVMMERRTFSAGQQLNIRGYGNGTRGTNGINSNFDGQGYKVYLNGIPITDAEGITVMDDIDFGSVGGVEVVKGPSGTLYGQAIAGVVNLKMRKAEPGKISLGQDVLAGSYGLRRLTTRLSIGNARSSLMVSYGRQLYDGFMPHTKSTKDFVNVIGEIQPNERQLISTYMGFSNSYDERNGEITKEAWDTLDYSGNPSYVKNNAHSGVLSFRTGLSHTYKLSRHVSSSTSVFGTGVVSNVSSAGGWTDKSSVNCGFRSTLDTRFSLRSGLGISGITGFEWQQQNAQTLGYSMVADSFNLSGYNIPGPMRSNQNSISRTTTAFSEWTLSLPWDFSLTAGLGWSGLHMELNDRFYVASNNNPSNPNAIHKTGQYANAFNKMVSPHVALNKVFARKWSAYLSYSTGFKAPVSSYFFIPVTGQMVAGLIPEKATQYEAGSKGSLFRDRLHYQLAAFYTYYANKMTTIAVPNAGNTATSYVYVANAGEQMNSGLELAVRGVAFKSRKFIKSIAPFANLTYSRFRYGNFKYQQLSADKKSVVEADFSHLTVAGVPPVIWNAGVDISAGNGIYFNMTYSYRDKMYYTSDNKNQTGVYQLLNSKIGYTEVLTGHVGFDIYAGVNNITGHRNYAMVFLNQLPDAYLPAPNKANYFGGVNLKYIF